MTFTSAFISDGRRNQEVGSETPFPGRNRIFALSFLERLWNPEVVAQAMDITDRMRTAVLRASDSRSIHRRNLNSSLPLHPPALD
eukprot:768602-Hanusia_phi.AAC.16